MPARLGSNRFIQVIGFTERIDNGQHRTPFFIISMYTDNGHVIPLPALIKFGCKLTSRNLISRRI